LGFAWLCLLLDLVSVFIGFSREGSHSYIPIEARGHRMHRAADLGLHAHLLGHLLRAGLRAAPLRGLPIPRPEHLVDF